MSIGGNRRDSDDEAENIWPSPRFNRRDFRRVNAPGQHIGSTRD